MQVKYLHNMVIDDDDDGDDDDDDDDDGDDDDDDDEVYLEPDQLKKLCLSGVYKI